MRIIDFPFLDKLKKIAPPNLSASVVINSRYEPHITEGLTQMFVAGMSTHKIGAVAQTLMGVAPSRQHDQSPQPNAHPTV
jgi:hypothetical protein